MKKGYSHYKSVEVNFHDPEKLRESTSYKVEISRYIMQSCRLFTARKIILHRITESTVSGNLGHGISCTSTETDNHIFHIERSKVTNNGISSSFGKKQLEGVHLNATNQVFQIINSFLSGNRNGGLYAKLQIKDGFIPVSAESHIHGNTFEYNRGSVLFLEGTTDQYSNVKATSNYYSVNFASDSHGKVTSVCNITDLNVLFQGNVVYNNSGQYIMVFGSSQGSLRLLNNTFYRNRGLGINYGVTVLLNGKAEIHNNVFQNPNNRYQISTTLQGSRVSVDAKSNWWGESVLSLVESLIKDKTKDYRLSLLVDFQPFLYLPPQEVISGK